MVVIISGNRNIFKEDTSVIPMTDYEYASLLYHFCQPSSYEANGGKDTLERLGLNLENFFLKEKSWKLLFS